MLQIDLISGDDVGKRITVYAPGNNGTLRINASGYFREVLSSAVINSDINTNAMFVDCTNNGTNGCKNTFINASTANYVEFNCLSGSECDEFKLHCPKTSYYSKACNLSCSDTAECVGTVFVETHWWKNDFYFDCIGGTCNVNVTWI